MVLVGLVTTLAGFGVAVASLGMASSNSARLAMVLIGIVVSLVGILGILNPHYIKTAVWQKK